jgi:hypothetical protein
VEGARCLVPECVVNPCKRCGLEDVGSCPCSELPARHRGALKRMACRHCRSTESIRRLVVVLKPRPGVKQSFEATCVYGCG